MPYLIDYEGIGWWFVHVMLRDGIVHRRPKSIFEGTSAGSVYGVLDVYKALLSSGQFFFRQVAWGCLLRQELGELDELAPEDPEARSDHEPCARMHAPNIEPCARPCMHP